MQLHWKKKKGKTHKIISLEATTLLKIHLVHGMIVELTGEDTLTSILTRIVLFEQLFCITFVTTVLFFLLIGQ